jgi:hypothetical protein
MQRVTGDGMSTGMRAVKNGFSAWVAVAVTAVGVLGPGIVDAHHSYAMFDVVHEKTLSGTIREFQWTNPHTWIWIQVPTADGGKEEWGVEGMSPNFLGRRGWSRETLKPGDKVTIVIHPVKDGSRGGSFLRVTLADGRVLDMMGGGGAASKGGT